MKHILPFLCLCFCTVHAQVPSWSWAKNGGGIDLDMSYAIATDNNGSTYIVGSFESMNVTFGTFTLNNAQLDSSDVFIAKYDVNGNVQWAFNAGGWRNDEATSIAVDINGNAIITGYFYSDSITFGSFTLHNTNGYSDIFVAKYDPSGNVLWAENYGGIYDDRANGIAADNNGNFAITGYFLADTLFSGINAVLCTGSYDMFVAKIDGSGNVLWAKGEGTTNDDRGHNIAIDGSGMVIVGGTFRSLPLIIGNDTLYYAGGAYSDLFIAKYDYLGNHVWAISEGGTYLDETNALVADPAGDIFMAAIVYSSSIVIGNDTLVNSGSSFYSEVVIAKYDANGNALWAQNHGVPTGNDIAYSITVDMFGDAYLTGVHGPNIVFGAYTLPGTGMFITKYDGFNGIVQWAATVDGAFAYGIACDVGMGADLVVTGIIFNSTVSFGSTTLTNSGVYDVFIARMDQTLAVVATPLQNSISIFPNPAADVITISGLDRNSSHNVTITNALGQLILLRNLAQGEKTINVASLPLGIYHVNIKSRDGATDVTELLIH